MKRKILLALFGSLCLVLLLVALPLMTACPAPPPPPPTEKEEAPPPPPPPPERVETLKLGCTMPLNVAFGLLTKQGREVVVDSFNKSGGLVVKGQRYEIEFIIYDDEYSADKARSGIERLLFVDNVKHIVGMVGSGPTVAAMDLTEANKAFLNSGCITDKFIMPGTRYTARQADSMINYPARWAVVLKVYPDAKTVAIMSPDNESGRSDAALFTRVAEIYGQKVVAAEFYPHGTTDFTSIATKIAHLNPDLLTFGACEGGTDLGLQLKALYQAGYKGNSVAVQTLHLEEILQVVGTDLVEGLFGQIQSDLRPDAPELVKQYREDWVKKYGSWTPGQSYCFQAPFYGFIAAVQKADSLETDDIIAALEGLEFESLMGHSLMIKRPDLGQDRFCDCLEPLTYGSVRDGKLTWKATLTAEDILEALEKFYGYVGQWR